MESVRCVGNKRVFMSCLEIAPCWGNTELQAGCSVLGSYRVITLSVTLTATDAAAKLH